jgi:hypothetical protein
VSGRPTVKSSLLGTKRTKVRDGVNIDGIPFLEPGYLRHAAVGEFAIIGDAPKEYIVFPTAVPHAKAYIAKGPRKEGPIECVTEHLITCIGRRLPLQLAEGRLARLPVAPGEKADVRFLSRQFLKKPGGEVLVHGVELVARCFDVEEAEVWKEVPIGKEWHFYSVELIDRILERIAGSESVHHELRSAFARMMAFDALVGANDRHPQNWGLIENAIRPGPPRFSPIFDTARGLFWNHSEDRLERADTSSQSRSTYIENYAERSTPLIGIDRADAKPNHFDVISYMLDLRQQDRFGPPIRQVIRAFSLAECRKMLHVDFRRVLSRRRLDFILDLLGYRHRKLMKICETSR